METKKTPVKFKNHGFALLITIIVVGVVLSVGLAVLDLSIKQVNLSTNAKQSEIAFHAANAGMECARYWRRVEDEDMKSGQPISPSCFGVNSVSVSAETVTPAVALADGSRYRYTYEFTWGAAGDRCTKINTLVAFADIGGAGVTTTDMKTHVPGFPKDTTYCEPGARCTVISVKGYNRPCSTTGNYGTIEREVLLQF